MPGCEGRLLVRRWNALRMQQLRRRVGLSSVPADRSARVELLEVRCRLSEQDSASGCGVYGGGEVVWAQLRLRSGVRGWRMEVAIRRVSDLRFAHDTDRDAVGRAS